MDAGRKSEAQRFLRELQEKAFFKERRKIEVRNAEKTARLKALRLAKEAQDAQVAEALVAEALIAKTGAKSPKGRKAGRVRTLKATNPSAPAPRPEGAGDGPVNIEAVVSGDLK